MPKEKLPKGTLKVMCRERADYGEKQHPIRYRIGNRDLTFKELEDHEGTFIMVLNDGAKKHRNAVVKKWGHKIIAIK